jgi:anion-transporting  ArsA/GET3 family ATPase
VSLAAAPPPASAGSGIAEALICDRALVFVSGKGGSGKTTVAATLAVAGAHRSRRTIVCELAGADHIARAFGTRFGIGEEIRLEPNLWSSSIDAQQALREWLRRQPGGAVADAVLSRSPAFAHFVAAAPGAKELITIGKLLDFAGRAPDRTRAVPYDLVVIDAPSTGHALGMVAAPSAVGETAPRGPVGAQARRLHEVLADPRTTGYVGVSLPEEMSVREVLELDRGVRDALGRGLDLIVVNGVHPDRYTDEEASRLQELASRSRASGALRAALWSHRRARRHADYVRWLRDRAQAPVITLPFLFASTIGAADYAALAQDLTRATAGGSRSQPHASIAETRPARGAR